jgi:hypothetical protein
VKIKNERSEFLDELRSSLKGKQSKKTVPHEINDKLRLLEEWHLAILSCLKIIFNDLCYGFSFWDAHIHDIIICSTTSHIPSHA